MQDTNPASNLTVANQRGLIPRLPSINLDKPAAPVATTEKEIATPPPLRGRFDTKASNLTQAGVLTETNKQRASNNLSAYASNATLNAAANAKLQDMFNQQYFDHVGPDGRGPSNWVEDAGYAYIAVGENLAVGNFDGDSAIVAAWMASPGHRANILHKNFIEIGIAVAEGNFEGQRTWLAVQAFGTPAAACPNPKSDLQNLFDQKNISSNSIESQLDSEKNKLDSLIAQFDQLSRDGTAKINEGNNKIDQGNTAAQNGQAALAESLWNEGEVLQQEGQTLYDQAATVQNSITSQQSSYNSLVTQINDLNNELIDLADQLNNQISAYNDCIARFSS